MKVWLVMAHEGPAEDDTSPSTVERVFAKGTASFHPRRVPVVRCLCDEQGWSINEWEVEGT